MGNGTATHASIFDVLTRMHPAAQVATVLLIAVGGAGGGAGLLATLTQAPRLQEIEQRIGAIDENHTAQIAETREAILRTRQELSDLNLQTAYITCRTERALDPVACDQIREQVRALLGRSAGSGR